MLTVPLKATPSQTISVTLANQRCKLNVYQTDSLYVDLYVNDAPLVVGVRALRANKIVRDAYLGFIGDLAFFDTRGMDDPDYTGLGGRFPLIYLP